MDGTILNKKYSLVERVKALEEGGGYVLPVASDETLGGIKVGDGLSVDENGVLSANAYTPPAYSTSEVNTGVKWIDGNDIYFKTIPIPALPNKTTTSYPSGLTGENVIRFEAFANNSGSTIQIPFVSTDNNYSIEASYNSNTHDFVIYTKYDASAISGHVTLYYTKNSVTKNSVTKKKK